MGFMQYIKNIVQAKTNQLDDKKIHNNIILTDDMQLSLTAQKGTNLNVCVIGGA